MLQSGRAMACEGSFKLGKGLDTAEGDKCFTLNIRKTAKYGDVRELVANHIGGIPSELILEREGQECDLGSVFEESDKQIIISRYENATASAKHVTSQAGPRPCGRRRRYTGSTAFARATLRRCDLGTF